MQEQAQRFQTLLTALKINQLQLSKKLQVPYSQTNSIYKGKHGISMGYLKKLAEKYPDVNLNWLLAGKGEMFLQTYEVPQIGLLNDPGGNYEKSTNLVLGESFDSDDELRKRLGSNLSKLVVAWGMKKYQLFDILMPGTLKQSVTNYLSGSSQVPLYALIRLERITGIPISEWITRDLDDFPNGPLRENKRADFVINELKGLIKRLGG